MLGLDPRSIIFLAGVLALLMSLVLLLLQRSYPASITGLNEWAAGPFVCFVATLLLGSRGLIPDVLSVLAGNLMLLTGTALYYFGTQRFFGARPAYRRWLAVVAGTAPVFAWFLFVQPSYVARLVLFTLVMTVLLARHAWLMLRSKPQHIFTLLTAGVLALLAGIMVLRLVFMPFDTDMQDVLDRSPFQTVYLVGFVLCMLMISIGMVLMVTERVRREFENLATHDSLTGTLTRRAMIDCCEQELERCRRNGQSLALLMMDLDHFKQINDRYGHLVGDRVLVDFAARVGQQLRRPDRLGRFGGEEFVLLLPDTSPEEALLVAERIRASRPSQPGLPACTVSIGVTTLRDPRETLDALIARADHALYRAKDGGRDRVESSA